MERVASRGALRVGLLCRVWRAAELLRGELAIAAVIGYQGVHTLASAAASSCAWSAIVPAA
jgi:hypothetical protein